MGESMRGRLVAPEPRPEGLDDYAGQWVALVDGTVVLAAPTEHEMWLLLRDLDPRERAGLLLEYVLPDSDSYIVSAG